MKPVRVLGREYSIDILGATEEPRSAANLSDSLGIPIATCYRRVNELAAVGLLEEVPTEGDDAPRATQYRRTTDAMYVEFAPTPSFSAWSRVRRTVDADASALDAAVGEETPGRIRAAPTGVPGSNTAAAGEQQDPVGDDA
jgi:hypothetical protein